MSKIIEGLDKAIAHQVQNIVRQNPKGSAAEQILLGKFLGSDQGTYARNVLGKNHKEWIEHITTWLKKNQPRLEKEFNELDFSDLTSLAYDMYENYLAKQGQLEETNLPPRAAFNKKPKQKGSGYSKDDYEYTEFVPKGKEDKEAWAIKRTVAKQKLEKPKPKSMDTGFYKNYLSNRPVREFLDTGGGGDDDDELKRQIIEMYFEDGLRETEISRITGLSEVAVHKIIDQYERGDFTIDEGEVVSMQARRTPLVVAGSPYDWDIYDLRTNKMVANILGGDRHESPLYEIRIRSSGMTPTTRMLPTYVLRAGRNNNPPYKAYELVDTADRYGKIEKSPGPGGTTKLRPDEDDMLRHMFKVMGGGKYYGYDLNLVEEGLDQYEIIEKALGAKIMEVDDAMELGYTDWDPNDSSSIVYLGNQKSEGILKEYDTKTIDSVVQRLPKGLTIDNFISPAFKEYLYQKYYGPMKAGWDKLWPFFNKEYNEKHGIKEYKQNPHQILSGDVNFFDDMLLVIPKGLKSNELYTRAFKEFLYKKFGDKEWTNFKNNRYAYWDAYEKLGGNKPQGFFGKLKSKIGMDENLLNTYGDQLGLDEEEAGLGSLIDDLLNPQEPKTQESSIMKGLQAEETRKQRKPLSDKDQTLIQAIWGHEQQGMLQDRDRYLVYTAKHGIEADEPNYNAAMHHVYRIYKQFPKLDYPVLVYDRKTKTPLYFDGVEDYYNKTQPLKHKTHEGYSDGAQGGSGIGVEASPIVQAYQSQVDEHINTPGGMGQSYRKYEPKVSGTSESAVMKGLREFSPTLISPDERPEEFFRNLAAQWKFGTPEEKVTIEKTLKQMHYAIGDDMRYDPDGVFITGAKDYKGKSYMSWSIEELKPSQKLDEKCWDTHKQVGMKNKGGRMVPNCVPKESAVMKGIQSEEKVEEYKEIPSQRKIEFSKENPPDLYYLYQQFIQRMLNPENTIDPYEWIDKVNKHYGLNYTWKDYQKRGHNDQTNNWQKIVNKYIVGRK